MPKPRRRRSRTHDRPRAHLNLAFVLPTLSSTRHPAAALQARHSAALQARHPSALYVRHSSEGWNPVFDLHATMKQPCVYILASKKCGTLYIGVTSDLIKRIWEHKSDAVKGFTKQYSVHTLVWFEQHETMESAIRREKTLKAWKRDWKLNLIEAMNADWRDLYPDVI